MAGGWGSNPWGGGAYGGSLLGSVDLVEGVPVSEGLDVYVPLRLDAAAAINAFLVELTFSHDLDLGFTPILSPSNYGITPSLSVYSVSPGPAPNQVRLITAEQAPVVYTLTVSQAKSVPGDVIDPAHRQLNFAGFPIAPTFFATAQSRMKVQLTFSTAMLQNAEFTDPASYSLTDLQGNAITINSVVASGTSPIRRVTFALDSELDPGGYYVATLLSNQIKTTGGLTISPETDLFQWNEMSAPINVGPLVIRLLDFSGEVTTGLLGQPAGQVFFSPALDADAPGSSIQVDSVSLCTRAYDVYEMPELPDPPLLYTFGGNGPGATAVLGPSTVLFTTAERLGLARVNLTDSQQDTMPTAVDGPADATLVETIDITRAAFLNDSRWRTYPAVGAGSSSTNSTIFDGVDEYVTMGNVHSFDNTDTFSLVCWFKTRETDGALISKQDSAGVERGYSLSLTTGGKLRFELVSTAGSDEILIETIGSFNDYTWHQVVVTYAGTSLASGVLIYVDGVSQSYTVIEDTLSATTTNAIDFQLGAIDAISALFAGVIDDPAVYDIELTPANVTTLYNSGDPPDLTSVGPTGNLVGYWLMGDGDTYPTLTDNSANTNDGTMVNMEAADLVVDSPPAAVFITADNLSAIGAGPTTSINLQP